VSGGRRVPERKRHIRRAVLGGVHSGGSNVFRDWSGLRRGVARSEARAMNSHLNSRGLPVDDSADHVGGEVIRVGFLRAVFRRIIVGIQGKFLRKERMAAMVEEVSGETSDRTRRRVDREGSGLQSVHPISFIIGQDGVHGLLEESHEAFCFAIPLRVEGRSGAEFDSEG
jgi:hypothetical protein